MELTFRPRLTRGSHLTNTHTDGTGDFCLVEAVGFNVDKTVTDHHHSVDTVLAAMARHLNDRMCSHNGLDASAQICDECQARLWAVGERLAGTGLKEWSAGGRARLHVQLAITAAETVLRCIDKDSELYTLAEAAIEAATVCRVEPGEDNRRIARAAATAVDDEAFQGAISPAAWAGYAAGRAASAAVKYANAATLMGPMPEDYARATDTAVDAVSYAGGAVVGDPVASMRLARRVLNAFGTFVREADEQAAEIYGDPDDEDDAFGKATSQNETPGVSEGLCQACQAPCPVGLCADCVDAGAHVSGEVYPDDAGAAAAEAAEPQDAEAAYREAYAEAAYYSAAAPCWERTTVDGIGYGCVKVDEGHVEHVTALGAVWWAAEEMTKAQRLERACAAAPSWADSEAAYYADQQRRQVAAWLDVPVWAITPVETPTEEYEVVNDFDESDLADVADEAIGDAAALEDNLRRAAVVLTAIAAEHRPVAAWTRYRTGGPDVEYQTECCLSCRDANGNPLPSPCRTMVLLEGYGEA